MLSLLRADFAVLACPALALGWARRGSGGWKEREVKEKRREEERLLES